MRRSIIAILASALLVLGATALAGCAAPEDSEQLIREDLVSELDQIKNADEATVKEVAESMESAMASQAAQMEAMGISPEEIASSMFEGFDYAIDDIKVAGEEAVAEVTVTARDFSEFATGVAEMASNAMADPQQFAGMTKEQVMTAMGDQFKQILADLPLSETDISLDYEKKDGTWQMAPSATAELFSMFFQ